MPQMFKDFSALILQQETKLWIYIALPKNAAAI